MRLRFAPRRARYVKVNAKAAAAMLPPEPPAELVALERFDLLYRSLCALLYNYVPTSGHPGGSISSGRFVATLLFGTMAYDVGDPDRADADILSYAAGHKAMGLYAMWALRDEVLRCHAPELLPDDPARRLRLEDLLGFRRNPVTATPLFRRFGAKALDGHPTPATPFVRLATGASGVGVASSIGLAIAAADYWGPRAPVVHIVEGEGGMTPGRVSEALAAAGTASLENVVLHVDWNQSSIDSDRVCRRGRRPGEYVQWNPCELCYLHDWNVVEVVNGRDLAQIALAHRTALGFSNGQPTAIVYHTVKGWKYGIRGRASHGAGHPMCSTGFYRALAALGEDARALPRCPRGEQRCLRPGVDGAAVREECFWRALEIVRARVAAEKQMGEVLARRTWSAREQLRNRGLRPRHGAPDIGALYRIAGRFNDRIPEDLLLTPGTTTTLRAELGKSLNFLNRASAGAVLTAAADLLGSTSVDLIAEGFPPGFWNRQGNPSARLLAIGGICEDAIAGVLSGVSAYGRSVGVASSYGAFMAPLGHVAARLHAIGAQARTALTGEPYRPLVLVCAHAGLKTGEDGPTHADPQALQLLQEDFPPGTAVTLTPWDPQEVWPLLAAAFVARPAVIAAFVTRPSETVPDRAALGLAPAGEARRGLYCLFRPDGDHDVVLVLQESAVTYAFVDDALPRLLERGIAPLVYLVTSAELFDRLPEEERRAAFPEAHARAAMGITGFTLPTMYRWVTSELGRAHSLHPFRKGHYLGSGPGHVVLREAGLDGESQARAIVDYAEARARRGRAV